jgi:hypothetical protein
MRTITRSTRHRFFRSFANRVADTKWDGKQQGVVVAEMCAKGNAKGTQRVSASWPFCYDHAMNISRHLRYFVVAWLTLNIAHTHAAAQCAPWRDASQQLALGRYPVGHPRAAFPLDLPHADCGTAPSPDDIACEYFDAEGIAYVVDQIGVTRVEARKPRAKPGVKLPLGLRFGDTSAVVRRKLAAAPADSPVAALTKSRAIGTTSQSRTWATFACIEMPHNVLGSFYVTFDRAGRLAVVGMRLTI